MTKRKVTTLYRSLPAVPDVPLALAFIEEYSGHDRIALVGIDDEDFHIEILQADDFAKVLILDPHEKWVEEFASTDD